jgi:hypothetical protein
MVNQNYTTTCKEAMSPNHFGAYIGLIMFINKNKFVFSEL